MTFSFLILFLAHARELKLFCIGGFLLGLGTFFSGISSRRSRITNDATPSPTTPSAPLRANSEPVTAPELIRLSSGTAPNRSADMTQQQKIAAALARAGISNSTSSRESADIAVETLDPADSRATDDIAPQNQKLDFDSPPLNSALQHTTLVWCGLTLILISLFGFLLIH